MASAAPSPVAEPVIRITLPSNSAMGASRVLHRNRKPISSRAPSHEAARIAQYLGVIEGKRQSRPVCDPLGRRCVIAGPGPGALNARQERNGAGMAARVALGVGVDADQAQPSGADALFLLELAPARRFDGLADLDKSPGQGV